MKEQVCIAMSGGVDSSVAAVLLGQAGYALSGIHLRLCCAEEKRSDAEDAAAVAKRLGFPFQELDLSDVFQETVIRYFVEEYEAGRTPNPCAACNRAVKFGALLEHALTQGADYLATGHYARVGYDRSSGRYLLRRAADRSKDQTYFLYMLRQEQTQGADYLATGHYARVGYDRSSGRYLLRRAADRSKDQTYFLYMLRQEQLAHVLFPLGELTKEQVRQAAGVQGLVNAQKRDSQDICFVPDGDYARLIERVTGRPAPAGPFLDQEGRVLGQHKGLIRYTLGQHKGLGLSTEEPLYVLKKDAGTNAIQLGPDSALWSRELVADQVNLISVPELVAPMRVTAKTRYSQRESAATAEMLPDGCLRVVFDEPQRAVTPGQAVVLYDGEMVVGGGTIRG